MVVNIYNGEMATVTDLPKLRCIAIKKIIGELSGEKKVSNIFLGENETWLEAEGWVD